MDYFFHLVAEYIDNFLLPSVVIGHSRSYHFIQLSESPSEMLLSGPFSVEELGVT